MEPKRSSSPTGVAPGTFAKGPANFVIPLSFFLSREVPLPGIPPAGCCVSETRWRDIHGRSPRDSAWGGVRLALPRLQNMLSKLLQINQLRLHGGIGRSVANPPRFRPRIVAQPTTKLLQVLCLQKFASILCRFRLVESRLFSAGPPMQTSMQVTRR
jgi:hypothetical protein